MKKLGVMAVEIEGNMDMMGVRGIATPNFIARGTIRGEIVS